MSTPEDKGLNPNAREFAPPGGGGKKRGKKKGTSPVDKAFVMNPDATPWLPTSFQAGNMKSKKPVVILFGAPGCGIAEVGEYLANHFKGRYYSSHVSRSNAAKIREARFDKRPTTLWGDSLDSLSGLEELLSSTVNDASVKGYFLDIHSRNNSIFHYTSYLLKKHGLAPGQVLYLYGGDKGKLVENCIKEGMDESSAKKQIEYYLGHENDRLETFDGVKGLVTKIDAAEDMATVKSTAQHAAGIIFEKVLSYSLPHTSPSHGLNAVFDVAEYHYVLNSLSERVAGGDPRWPGTKDAGCLALNTDGKIHNSKAATDDPVKPTVKTHKISKKIENGVRYLLVYCPVYNEPNEGRFYLVPKHMDAIYTFKARIGDQVYEEGKAPLYGDAGSPSTICLDGEVVMTKAGWGGLKGMGCQQLLFVASDILYFEAEKPRDRFSKNDQWSLEKRLEVLSRTKWPQEDAAPADTTTLSLCLKTYHPLWKLPSMLEALAAQSDNYSTSGIVFTSLRKYTPISDSQLITWVAPTHRRINLKVVKQKSGKLQILAMKTWSGSETVEVSEIDESSVVDGNAQCRIIRSANSDSYRWVVDGPAANCWEISGVKTYTDPQFWISPEALQKEFYCEEPEKKARVERVEEAEAVPEPEEASAPPGGRGGGKGSTGGRGSGRGR